MKYHIDKNGKPAICRATKRPCPLGGDDVHFDTEQAAQDYSDKLNEQKFGLIPGQEAQEREELIEKNISEALDEFENEASGVDLVPLVWREDWDSSYDPDQSDYYRALVPTLDYKDGKIIINPNTKHYDYVGEVEVDIVDFDYYSPPEGKMISTEDYEDENLENMAYFIKDWLHEYNSENPDKDYGEYGMGLEGLVNTVKDLL